MSLIDTVFAGIGRTLLVPSTVVLLGRQNWWPSRMSRQARAGSAAAIPAAAAVSPAGPGRLQSQNVFPERRELPENG
jgi:hypothetical protein